MIIEVAECSGLAVVLKRGKKMAELLILTFEGVTKAEYDAVNEKLSIDMGSGEGDWPPGLITHAGGQTDDGEFHVVEVWESRELQEKFLHERLGAALGAGGITVQPSVKWVSLFAFETPGVTA